MNKKELIAALQAEARGKATIDSATAIRLASQLNEREAATGKYYIKGKTIEQWRVATGAIANMKVARI